MLRKVRCAVVLALKPRLSTWSEHLGHVAHHPDKSWSSSPSSGLVCVEPGSDALTFDPLNFDPLDFAGLISGALMSGGRMPGGHCGGSRSGCSAWYCRPVGEVQPGGSSLVAGVGSQPLLCLSR